MLVLLCTVAQRAWAGWDGGTYTATEPEILGSINVSTATLAIQSGVTVRVYGSIVITGTLTVTGSGLRSVQNSGFDDPEDNLDISDTPGTTWGR